MSPAFLSAVELEFKSASVTVDWFHVVQLFTKTVDDVRKLEARQSKLPAHTRWGVLGGRNNTHAESGERSPGARRAGVRYRHKAYRVQRTSALGSTAESKQTAKWRIPHFLKYATEYLRTARYWNLCAEHWLALGGTCHESFIVGIPCTPMRGTKESRACSKQQGLEAVSSGFMNSKSNDAEPHLGGGLGTDYEFY